MKRAILIAGLACFSVVAVAQSATNNDQAASSSKVSSPRDMATGQASGKRESPSLPSKGKTQVAAGDVNGDGKAAVAGSADVKSPRDLATGQASGKRESPSLPSKGKTQVATGDVNGDGKADVAASSSGVKSPRDAATGQASGKRQHSPVTFQK